MRRRPPRATRTDTHLPCTTLFRSVVVTGDEQDLAVAIDPGSARRVTDRPIAVVHAVEEHAAVGDHPEVIVRPEPDDQRLVGRPCPAQKRDGTTTTGLAGTAAGRHGVTYDRHRGTERRRIGTGVLS